MRDETGKPPRSRQASPAAEKRAGELMLRVRHVVNAVARRVPGHLERDDMLGAAYVGLAEALAKGATGNRASFEAYALRRARWAITDHLRTHDVLTRSQRATMRLLTKVIQRLVADLGRTPTDEEIVDAAGTLDEKRVRTALRAAAVPRLFSSIDDVPSDEANSPDRVLLLRRKTDAVRRALQTLPSRLQLVLDRSYFDDKTLEEIGTELGVSAGRVCQLRKQALLRLRASDLRRLASTRPPPRCKSPS